MTRMALLAVCLSSTLALADEGAAGFFGNHNLPRGKVIPSSAVTVKGAQASGLLDDDVTTAECLRFDDERPPTITFRFDKARLATGVSLVALHAKSLATAQEHGRVAEELTVTTEGGTARFDLRDYYQLAVASPKPDVAGRPFTDEVEPSPIERLRSSHRLQVGKDRAQRHPCSTQSPRRRSSSRSTGSRRGPSTRTFVSDASSCSKSSFRLLPICYQYLIK